jgi:DNA-binding NtrC family response regulator
MPLVVQLVAQLAAKHRVAPPRLPRAVAAALCAYDWPGNVRELRNVIERLCVLRGGRTVRAADLPPGISIAARAGATATATATARADAALSVRLDQPLEATIDEIIRAAVALEGGNLSRAAERLGIGLRTVQRRLRGVVTPAT